jgi:hypothetical protein
MRALLGGLAVLAGLLVPAAPAAAAGPPLIGVVTAAGQPVAHAWVRYLPVTASGGWAGLGEGTRTDEQGRYAFAAVPSSHVKVHVRAPAVGGVVSTYYPQAFTFEQAVVLVVRPGLRADVALPRGGSVRGRVVDARTGEGIPGAVLSAHAGSEATESVGAPALSVGPDGAFTLADLPPVPVAVRIDAPMGGDHLSQWFDTVGYPQVATRLDGARHTRGLVVGLERGGSIRGTVRDDAGQPVAGASVALIGCRGRCPMVAQTAQDGRYHLRGVPPGAGMLLHAWAQGSGLLEAFHREEGTGREGWLRIAGGQALTGIDVVLRRGSWLTVDVVDAETGAPIRLGGAELISESAPLLSYLPGVRDRLLVWSGSGLQAHTEGTAGGSDPATIGTGDGGALGRDGPLQFGPIPAGEYRVSLFPGARNSRYLPVRIDQRSEVDPRGRIALPPGEQRRITVLLVPNPDAPPAPAGDPAPAAVPPADARGDERGAAGSPVPGTWPVGVLEVGSWPGLDPPWALVLSAAAG